MYNNQYIAFNYDIGEVKDFNKSIFNNITMYTHKSLNVTKYCNMHVEVLLLGYIINPLCPKQNNDNIVKSLADHCQTKENFFREVQSLSGRYVLFYKNEKDFVVLNDPCAFRNIYYCFDNKNIIITSSQKLFQEYYKKNISIPDDKLYFIKCMLHYESTHEFSWFGDEGIDDKLYKVLPNIYLDIKEETTFRIPVYLDLIIKESDIVEYSSVVLRGNMDAITNMFNVIQPITAGWDSRACLAAAKDCVEKIHFYVFDKSGRGTDSPDIWVPKNLSRKLGINFDIIQLDDVREDFLSLYMKEHLIPRLCKIMDMQYLYDHFSNKNVVRVSGVSGNIIKCVYGYTYHAINSNILSYFTYYPARKCKYIKNKINEWLDQAKDYSHLLNIPILDLFYWEQRVGNWGALYAHEQDIAIEEFCPHNHRNLLLSMLNLDPEYRGYPECKFILDLINHLWPETLSEPINPVSKWKKYKKALRRYSLLRYYDVKIHSDVESLYFKPQYNSQNIFPLS